MKASEPKQAGPWQPLDFPPEHPGRGRRTAWLFNAVLFVATALLVLLLLLPVAALLLHVTPARLLALMTAADVVAALRVTLLSSAASTLLIFLLGLPVAYAISRYFGRGRFLLDSLLELPMVMPPVVAGLALLLAFGRRGLVGVWLAELGIQLPFTLAAVVLAQVFLLTPYFVKRAVVLFDGVDRRLEEVATLLGAGPFRTFFAVSLPLCRRGLLAEAIMALAQGIGMFGAVILFAGNLPGRTQTLSLAIYSTYEGNPEKAFALSALLLVLSCLLLLGFRLLSRPLAQEG
ncbi:molybdate ABC transporter permease subunit [Desulfuromonas sp. KJ2020]|uniref:molybdate ABC transporter permease subunit n=1 Tax=Desulfuromonas sp. KJ2020 TaxID=2919173 RepID=UPI0020A7972D|nr:molybdate ABC transporter permease subunit [Desulfuromonas sp. KJ2020]MCP3176840.1 molybdate ABC transporter permease subunit [Desulfuromonas sp. KJ2020]